MLVDQLFLLKVQGFIVEFLELYAYTYVSIRYIIGILEVPMTCFTEISIHTAALRLGLEVDLHCYNHREVCDAKPSYQKMILWRKSHLSAQAYRDD